MISENMVTFDINKGLAVPRPLFTGLWRIHEPVQYLQSGPLARYHRALDDALQLAHVARPVVFLEYVQGVFRHGLDLLSCFFVVLPIDIFMKVDVLSLEPAF
jgi:hypothetical protein